MSNNALTQLNLMTIDLPKVGDVVLRPGGQGKIAKFSADYKRALVSYWGFDGEIKAWYDLSQLDWVRPIVGTKGDSSDPEQSPPPSPLPAPQRGGTEDEIEPLFVLVMLWMQERLRVDASERVRYQQQKMLLDVIPTLATKQLIKVMPIGDDGLTIPSGWTLQGVNSVFDVIHERTSHYAVIQRSA